MRRRFISSGTLTFVYPQVFGKYLLEEELARGGMARVLLATLRGAGGFEKKLVVKQIRDEYAEDPDFVQRFVDEANTTVRLNHPNIVTVYELGVELGTYYLAMEYVDGVSLSELTRNERDEKITLAPEEGAYIGLEVAHALDYAHRKMNVIHRDVTPRNVMVDQNGRVKLIDFGIAAKARGISDETYGSPGYMAPEQLDGKELGPETDLFALVVVLMEVWTGTPLFRRTTEHESREATFAPRVPPSSLVKELGPANDVLLRSLAIDRRTRPESAEALVRALQPLMAGHEPNQIARRLGDRVTEVLARRKRPSGAQPKEAGGEPGARANSSSDAPVETATFAQREEVVAWKPSDPTEGTRKVIEPKSDGSAGATNAAPAPSSVRRIATALAIVLIGGGALALANRGSQVTPLVPSALPSITTTTPSTAPSSSASTILTPSATASATPSATSLAVPSIKRTAAPPASTSAAITVTGTVGLFGEPGTRFSIDGIPYEGAASKKISLPVGDHEVRAHFEPTGESRGEKFTLHEHESVTIVSNFSGSTPSLAIRRGP